VTTSAAAQALYRVAAGTQVRADGGVVQGDLAVSPPAGAPSSWTTAAMVRLLYRRCYLGRTGDDLQAETADNRPAFAREDAALGAALRTADGGRWIWEPGWRHLSGAPDGGAILENEHGLSIRAAAEEFRIGLRGAVEVRFPTARPYASPGFFLVSGTTGLAFGPQVVRWYLGIESSAAPAVLGTIVGELDRRGIRYTFKVLSDPASYPRPDAAVLYAARQDLDAVHRVVLGLHDDHPARFRPAVPLFTLRVRDGIAVAEDPPRATVPLSFGQHRCRLVAKGIVDAGPDADAATRFRSVAASFAAAGISVDTPHLNPGSPRLPLPDRDGEPCAA
jgi:hypothetical protein